MSWNVEYTDEYGEWWNLLNGGNKTGNNRWYKEFVPKADRLYDEHLKELKQEGLI